MDPQHAFRREMEERRMPGSTNDEEETGNDAEEEFVEQVKADAESAPTIEDTIPKEGE